MFNIASRRKNEYRDPEIFRLVSLPRNIARCDLTYCCWFLPFVYLLQSAYRACCLEVSIFLFSKLPRRCYLPLKTAPIRLSGSCGCRGYRPHLPAAAYWPIRRAFAGPVRNPLADPYILGVSGGGCGGRVDRDVTGMGLCWLISRRWRARWRLSRWCSA